MSGNRGLNFHQACDTYFADELSELLREAAYARLLAALIAGRLKATGIRTLPQVDRKPSLVPSWMFDQPRIDWDMDTVENAGSKFERVRVHAPEEAVGPPIGRPTKKTVILRILVELQQEGGDLSQHQSRLCDQVRARAKQEGYSFDGLSDKVIKPLIRQVRDAPLES